jgi:hypothetical protein
MKKAPAATRATTTSQAIRARRSKTRPATAPQNLGLKSPGQLQSAGYQNLPAAQRQTLAAGLGKVLGNQQLQRQLIQRAPASLHDRIIATAEKTKKLKAILRVIKQASDQEIEKLDFSEELRSTLINTVGIPDMIKAIGAITNRQEQIQNQIEAAKRKKFLEDIEDTDRYILLANMKSKAWLGSIGNAYYNAWDQHNKTLEAQKEENESSSIGALIGGFILDAALSFVTGGIGGLVAKKMRGIVGKDPTNHGAFMLDGIKDLSKFGVKSAGGKAIGMIKEGDAGVVEPYPIDPFLWKGREEVRINTELGMVTQKMIEWTTKVKTKDPDFDYQFDPVQAVRESLSVRGIPVDTLVPVNEEQEAKNFEKGFWASWLKEYAYSANLYGATSIEDPVLQIPIKKTPISEIVKRCKEIGLDAAPYVEASKQRAKRTVEDAKKAREGKLEA